jgi:hypothetical protein
MVAALVVPGFNVTKRAINVRINPNSRSNASRLMLDVVSAPRTAPGPLAIAKTVAERKSIRFDLAYANVPESALKKTTVSEMLVMVSGSSCGYSKSKTGSRTNPPPAPMIVP